MTPYDRSVLMNSQNFNDTTQPSIKVMSTTPATKYTHSIGVDYMNIDASGLEAISEFNSNRKPNKSIRGFSENKYTPTGTTNFEDRTNLNRWRKFNTKGVTSKRLQRKERKLAKFRHDTSERQSKVQTNHTLVLDSTQLVEHQSIFTPGVAMSEDSESIHQHKSTSIQRTSKMESPSEATYKIQSKNDSLLIKSEDDGEIDRQSTETPIQVSKIKLTEKIRDMEEHMKAMSILKLDQNNVKMQCASSFVKSEEAKHYENLEFSTIKVSDNIDRINDSVEDQHITDIKSPVKSQKSIKSSVISQKSIRSPTSNKQIEKSIDQEADGHAAEINIVEVQQAGPQKMNVDILSELNAKLTKPQNKSISLNNDVNFENQNNLSRSINFKIARPEQTSIESSKALDTRKTFFEADSSSSSSDKSPKIIVKETISSKYKKK